MVRRVKVPTRDPPARAESRCSSRAISTPTRISAGTPDIRLGSVRRGLDRHGRHHRQQDHIRRGRGRFGTAAPDPAISRIHRQRPVGPRSRPLRAAPTRPPSGQSGHELRRGRPRPPLQASPRAGGGNKGVNSKFASSSKRNQGRATLPRDRRESEPIKQAWARRHEQHCLVSYRDAGPLAWWSYL